MRERTSRPSSPSSLVAAMRSASTWKIIAALGASVAVGVINGAFVIIFGIDPFIVTLGTGTFVYGVVLWISASNTISGVSAILVTPVIVDRFLGVPLEFYYGLAICV